MAWHISFFLKSLESLEDFRIKSRTQTPSKSPCTNFQSLAKFQNSNKNSKRILFDSGPPDQLGPAAQSGPRSLSAQKAQPAFSFLRSSRTEPPPRSGTVAHCRPGLPAALLPPPRQAHRLPSFPHQIASPPHYPLPFISMLKRLALMPQPPATARRPCSLPGPIKGAHTPTRAHRPRLHSPFLPSSLGAPPSPSHFGRHLSPSPGHLAAFRSQVRSQAGSSPPPPLFGCHRRASTSQSTIPAALQRAPAMHRARFMVHLWCTRSTQPRTRSTTFFHSEIIHITK
jgi:hypothetical protein